eukprot:scaffold2.g7019.t1
MVRIGTHSGSFHADEALGCFLLKQTAKFEGADVVRTRDPLVLEDLDVVIDVGAVYEPERERFDHHQRGFTEVFGHGFNTKLSSAGLVYKHYGREIVGRAMGLPANHADVGAVYLAVYKNFMEAIDAIDNGINQWDAEGPPKYVNNTHLSARVGRLNPDWNEEQSAEEVLNERFRRAMALTGEEFTEASWLPARSHVKAALEQRLEVDPSGEIVKMTTLEEEMGIAGSIKYVLYEASEGREGWDEREKKWRVQAVGVAPGSFESRRPLPQAWRGFRDSELSELAGIPGCVFVHAGGFIGGHATEEGAAAMARKALSLD